MLADLRLPSVGTAGELQFTIMMLVSILNLQVDEDPKNRTDAGVENGWAENTNSTYTLLGLGEGGGVPTYVLRVFVDDMRNGV